MAIYEIWQKFSNQPKIKNLPKLIDGVFIVPNDVIVRLIWS
jgi:hypothetical protein